MSNILHTRDLRFYTTTLKLALGAAIVASAATYVRAQGGEIPSGTVAGSGSGPTYTYNLTFSDAAGATDPIGSVWYSWVPGQFFLPSDPMTAAAPAGWTANLSGTQNSVQFLAGSASDYIQPGQTLSGFSYTASFSPSQLAAAPNSGKSVAYIAGLFSDPGGNGVTFFVQTAPEPSSLALIAVGVGGVFVARRRRVRG